MRLPALPSNKKCYQGSVGYCQQTASALDALLNRRHSHSSARCFDGLPAIFEGKFDDIYSLVDSMTQKFNKRLLIKLAAIFYLSLLVFISLYFSKK